jgi:hypothetical protein
VAIGRRSEAVVEVLRELVTNDERTLLTKRQIAFFDESIALKRQNEQRSKAEHEVTMRAAAVREKKDGVDLLISLQRSVSDMRRALGELQQAGRQQDEVEIADLERCIAKLRSAMDACL